MTQMYKFNKDSVGFLFDNDLLTVNHQTITPDLLTELADIKQYLECNLVDVKLASQEEPIQVYSSMLLAIIEYHVDNAVTIDKHYEQMNRMILDQACCEG